ncbi:MAG: aquaporin family protein [Lactobacillaceae bacterium]|nr:aquaporin family protein [Lactobacillaceae bacterium]
MDSIFISKLMAEFLGTALMIILGNGAVANAELKNTKGEEAGWLNIALGFGAGIGIAVMIFDTFSANFNPAMTLTQAVFGNLPWSSVLPYFGAQMLGAIAGQIAVYLLYKPYFDVTTNTDSVFAPFATTDQAGSRFNGAINEFTGTFTLIIGALAITTYMNSPISRGLALAVLVAGVIMSLGGATGPALNPVRDLGPRIVHALLPLRFKGSSHWQYAWVPVVFPLLGGLSAGWLWFTFFAPYANK